MGNQKKILVIDDDPDTVTFLTTLLEDNGYACSSAKDGAEGLNEARATRPDLVLLDITMPETSGVRFYRDLRDDPALASLPVVMVTGVSQEFERFISTRRQVPPPDGYISKPIDKEKLLRTVADLLRTP